jgi:adenylylsulfate kinase-like enzyme
LAGLPGSGKSALAHTLQTAMEKALPAVVLDKDRVRAPFPSHRDRILSSPG